MLKYVEGTPCVKKHTALATNVIFWRYLSAFIRQLMILYQEFRMRHMPVSLEFILATG